MKLRLGIGLVLVLGIGIGFAACTRVVDVRTTSEIRPMRYAITEVTKESPQDSAMTIAKRALAAENIKLLREVQATGTIEGGPIRFAAEGDQPALDATITITASMDGSASKFRIYASAVMPAGAVGGIDPRLTALVERIGRRIQ